MSTLETVTGTVKRVRFCRDDFAILVVVAEGDGQEKAWLGPLAQADVGDEITAQGTWGVDPEWGPQFKVESASVTPNSVAGFVAWAVERIPHLGGVRAQALWAALGKQVWTVLREGDTAPLVAVQGITMDRAREMIAAYEKHAAEAEVVIPLMDLGFGLPDARRIVRSLQHRALEMWAEDAYSLMSVKHITFQKIDKIAGYEKSDPRRIHGWAADAIEKQMGKNGCTRVTSQELLYGVRLAGGMDKFSDAMAKGKNVINLGGGDWALKAYYFAEKHIAEFLGAGGEE